MTSIDPNGLLQAMAEAGHVELHELELDISVEGWNVKAKIGRFVVDFKAQSVGDTAVVAQGRSLEATSKARQ